VRLQYGLFPLAPDARLAGTSLAHSQLMAGQYLEAHQIPPERDPGGRLDAAGYRWNYERENLAEWPVTSSAADLVQEWLTADAAHRDNLLATNVWDMGIGVVIGPFDTQHPGSLIYWVTQDMGREGDANYNVHLGKFQISSLQLTVNAVPNTPAAGAFTITNAGDSFSRLVGVVSLDNT